MDTQTEQSATYVIGDLHGALTLLQSLLDLLPLQPQDHLVFLGDYMDRGDESVATVLFLGQMATTQRCIFLRGNHDEAWLECWNGSAFTHYPKIPGARKVWEEHHGLIPSAVGRFLEKTHVSYEDGYAYYAHAGAQPGVPFWQSAREGYIWGWHDFFTNPASHWGKLVIVGHYEVEKPLVTETIICVDTAGYRTGRLTALRVADRHLFQT